MSCSYAYEARIRSILWDFRDGHFESIDDAVKFLYATLGVQDEAGLINLRKHANIGLHVRRMVDNYDADKKASYMDIAMEQASLEDLNADALGEWSQG